MTATVAAVTVTLQVAVFAPSLVLTVIVVVPSAFAVTIPEEDTVATIGLLVDHETSLFDAFDGVTVAIKDWDSPSVNVNVLLFKVTPVTEIVFALTVTEHVAVFSPSTVFTVIVAVPTDLAVTKPEEETVAIDVLLDDHVTDLLVALDGNTVAVRAKESPSVIEREVLSRLTLVTDTVFSLTVIEQVDFFPPSVVVTVIIADPAAFAVTSPVDETVATVVLFDDQETDLSVAFVGKTVAVKLCVSPTVMLRLV